MVRLTCLQSGAEFVYLKTPKDRATYRFMMLGAVGEFDLVPLLCFSTIYRLASSFTLTNVQASALLLLATDYSALLLVSTRSRSETLA